MEKKTILIIEDNTDIREGTTEILELTGRYHVLAAENGRDGVDLATTHLPDLILCDIMMPELDGYGVLYILSKNEETAHIPFIFLTAKVERSDMRKAMELGADDYLTKPFDDVELLNAIDVRFKKRGQIGEAITVKNSLYLSPEEQDFLLKELIEKSRVKVFKKKQSIYEEGDVPVFVYFVLSGQVRSFLCYNDGRELSTDIQIAGTYIGYEAMLLNENYSDNVEAIEKSEIALISKEDFFELIYRKPLIAGKFIQLLSGNIREKEEQLLGFAYDTVRKRIANALISVAEKTVNTAIEDECVIQISREGIATIAGTANETISRVLADFREENLIAKEKSAIRIFSVKKLRKVKQ
ncbi:MULTISPECIES: response regulator [Sphingobacterium]|uniref:Response regulator n=1 Tax=Sphingobacterium kitahiroshimense TaxID=470446 RepID=A0ABV0C0L4_9SPHI|nr:MULTISPECIES: response regulator [Sphingobacterium]MBB2952461.1 CheY-like chemotaxis protein [Sphingobacterium sp. JUb56]MCS3557492.1 CheY-like chemotaxis protein [Sphingobacterium sp. JUb21]MCW2260920.1 CheY-like chemotaxis protein [Sphingobacterium kitahiroshimense]NJI76428.1 response regulator [Sphingobacterium sp. B16(2022)]QQD11908.1 response regulator [Sphingobacterium sp. UDSM-2020]